MIKNREYSFSVNSFNKPNVYEGNTAIGVRLLELITMEPGDDPLHPDMGVGINKFRYGLNNLDDLKKRVESQIATYLPMYQNVQITLITTPNKVVNIEIHIGDSVFIYDSNEMPKSIKLEDLK